MRKLVLILVALAQLALVAPAADAAPTWYLRNSNTAGPSDISFAWGAVGWTPVKGDWNGDGIDTIGEFKNGEWYLRNTNAPSSNYTYSVLGQAGDIPVPGRNILSWQWGNMDAPAVFRNGLWIAWSPGAGTSYSWWFGGAGMKPLRRTLSDPQFEDGTVAVSGNTWYTRWGHTTGYADQTETFGNSTDIPLTGKWFPSSGGAPRASIDRAPASSSSTSRPGTDRTARSPTATWVTSRSSATGTATGSTPSVSSGACSAHDADPLHHEGRRARPSCVAEASARR